jgi:hypothetical protein
MQKEDEEKKSGIYNTCYAIHTPAINGSCPFPTSIWFSLSLSLSLSEAPIIVAVAVVLVVVLAVNSAA